jgi:hypothetical protein
MPPPRTRLSRIVLSRPLSGTRRTNPSITRFDSTRLLTAPPSLRGVPPVITIDPSRTVLLRTKLSRTWVEGLSSILTSPRIALPSIDRLRPPSA